MAKSVDAEKRAEELREKLNRANYLYHIESRPEISDREFITKPFRKWRDGRSDMAAKDGTLAKHRKFPQC